MIDGGIEIDLDEVVQNIAEAEVVSLFFPTLRRTLLIDTRTNEFAGSFVKVVRTADTGEFVAEEEYAALGLRHELPRPEASAPWFTVARDGERTTLHAVGTDEALASIARAGEQYEDIAVARPGGGYATARLGPTRSEFMLFAPGRPPRKLVDGWAHGLVWLPAEGAAGGGR